MPRRGRSAAPSRNFRSAPPRPAPAPAQVPAHGSPSAAAPMGAQPRQPGMFAQMATTAAGVAVGSAVGHTIAGGMLGGGGGGGGQVEAAPQQTAPQQYQDQQQPQVCGYELRQFLECAQQQADITLCTGFNEALRQCRLSNGVPMQ